MTPSEHFAEAGRLLARVADMEAPTLPICRALVAQAQAHATLAQCGDLFPERCAGFEIWPYPEPVTPELKGDIL